MKILHLIYVNRGRFPELRAQLQASEAYVLQGCLKPLRPSHVMNHLSKVHPPT